MPHWLDKVTELLNADTADLQALALMAGGDPTIFYRGISVEDVDLANQNLRGLDFAFAEGQYSFIRQQLIVGNGTLGKIMYSYTIRYPQFERRKHEFLAVNRSLADAAEKAANNATPNAASNIDREQNWTHEQKFKIHQPSINAVTVEFRVYGFTGGAHGYAGTYCTLIDLRTGKVVGPEDVFVSGGDWLKAMVTIVSTDLRKQFVERPGFPDALEPSNLETLLRDSNHYCWQVNKLELVFNAYEIGPYAVGPYNVEVPHVDLGPLLRAEWRSNLTPRQNDP